MCFVPACTMPSARRHTVANFVSVCRSVISGIVKSAWVPKLADALAHLPVDNAWIDGEAVVLDASGKPDFNGLQNAFDRRSTSQIILFVFDLLWINGADVRQQPLRARRKLLRELVAQTDGPFVRFSEDFAEDPASLVASACKMRLEGIIGKRGDAPYRSGRSTDWVKLL